LQNKLANRLYETYEDIVEACCEAWNRLMAMPEQIASIATRGWAFYSAPLSVTDESVLAGKVCSRPDSAIQPKPRKGAHKPLAKVLPLALARSSTRRRPHRFS